MNKKIIVHSSEDVGAPDKNYDLFIAASGFEERSVHIASKLHERAKSCVAIGFDHRKLLNFDKNCQWFKDHGFSYIEATDAEFSNAFLEVLKSNVGKGSENVIQVAIDISCFNRFRLATIIEIFSTDHSGISDTQVDFLYSIASYSSPLSTYPLNTHIGPVSPQFAGWTNDPSLPPVALIGLGFEEGKALGAVDHLEISHVMAFIPNSPESAYLPAVKQANASLLSILKPGNLFQYSVNDPCKCIYMLESVVNGISGTYNPIFLPLGPKIFTICALLVAKMYPHTAVWRVSAGAEEEAFDRKASDFTVNLSVSFLRNLADGEELT